MNRDPSAHPPKPRSRWAPLAVVTLGALFVLFIGFRIRQRLETEAPQPIPPLAVRTHVLRPVAFSGDHSDPERHR